MSPGTRGGDGQDGRGASWRTWGPAFPGDGRHLEAPDRWARQRRAPSVSVCAGRAPRPAGRAAPARPALAPHRCPALLAAAPGVSEAAGRADTALRAGRSGGDPAELRKATRRWFASPALWESLSLFCKSRDHERVILGSELLEGDFSFLFLGQRDTSLANGSGQIGIKWGEMELKTCGA